MPALHAAAGRGWPPRPRATAGVPDLFALVRVVALRISVERLIGPGVLRAAGAAFLDAFMAFQDQLEDATAKAAVLPRWLARPLILRRGAAAARRARAARRGAERRVRLRRRRRARAGRWRWSRGRDDAAELCIGLLFAAAKNPAIAAAQAPVRAAGRRRDGRARARRRRRARPRRRRRRRPLRRAAPHPLETLG